MSWKLPVNIQFFHANKNDRMLGSPQMPLYLLVQICTPSDHLSYLMSKSLDNWDDKTLYTYMANLKTKHYAKSSIVMLTRYIALQLSPIPKRFTGLKAMHECFNHNRYMLFTPLPPLDPVTCIEFAPLYWVYRSIGPTTGFD